MDTGLGGAAQRGSARFPAGVLQFPDFRVAVLVTPGASVEVLVSEDEARRLINQRGLGWPDDQPPDDAFVDALTDALTQWFRTFPSIR
jgi:hypothetical protein